MQLEDRKKKVLEAIILDYIATAEPVGSRTITKKYDLGVSPATIRNEMADLEDLGLIEQPHTSAGRIPSQFGYRYYVDYLMEKENLTNEIKNFIRKNLRDEIRAKEDIVQGAVRLLSQISRHTAVLILSTYSQNVLTHIQLLPVGDRRMVLILVLDNGHVEHQVIELEKPLSEREIGEMADMLRQAVCGLTVAQWRKLSLKTVRSQWEGQIHLLKEILDVIEDTLTVEYERKLYLSGTLNIMNQPEFRDVDKVRQVLSLLEEQRIMEDLMMNMDEGESRPISIKIGTENEYENLSACSLVTATYHINGRVMGRIGLLGPTRMDYSRNISLLDYMSRYLSEGLKPK
ncbi:MAG: heat-inducible transcriptional repressor HrcA [Clostridiales bacterium]|nr:heat-inducible transcriptional repressor HrcA [Clostridiales bacterium]